MASKKLINRWGGILCVSEHLDLRWHSLNLHNRGFLTICNGSPETAVDEALEGLVILHPGLRLLQDHRVVVREKVIMWICLPSLYLHLVASHKLTNSRSREGKWRWSLVEGQDMNLSVPDILVRQLFQKGTFIGWRNSWQMWCNAILKILTTI